MLSTLSMTIIGADRPGLVQLVADRVAAHGGNWLESRMCRLGGQFAGIARVEIDTADAAELHTDLINLEKEGLRIQIQTERIGAGEDDLKEPLVTFEIVGHDRPGIVLTITSVLSDRGVNVEEFSSEVVSAPMDGARLFKASAKVRLPRGVSSGTVRQDLERIASDLLVDLQVS